MISFLVFVAIVAIGFMAFTYDPLSEKIPDDIPGSEEDTPLASASVDK